MGGGGVRVRAKGTAALLPNQGRENLPAARGGKGKESKEKPENLKGERGASLGGGLKGTVPDNEPGLIKKGRKKRSFTQGKKNKPMYQGSHQDWEGRGHPPSAIWETIKKRGGDSKRIESRLKIPE